MKRYLFNEPIPHTFIHFVIDLVMWPYFQTWSCSVVTCLYATQTESNSFKACTHWILLR